MLTIEPSLLLFGLEKEFEISNQNKYTKGFSYNWLLNFFQNYDII